MRYVNSISPAPKSPNTLQVMGLSAAHSLAPVHPHTKPPYEEHHENEHRIGAQAPPNVPVEDRRKACRRVSHQAVLIELRSGVDRRHHNLREGDVADHIDIEA
ncbi:MAG: hypothetical protein R8K20_04780 [Gallionellaceae bacterium]